MTDMNLTSFFVTALTTYGPPALGLAALLGTLGLPIPTGLLVLAAGAFARQGLLDGGTAALLALLGAVVGDSGSFALGRRAGGWLQQRVKRWRDAWQTAQDRFEEHGNLAIYLTRFVLTSLDVPTNLVAGSSRLPFRRFLAWDVAGRLNWLLLYGGLGYAVGNQWQAVSGVISHYGNWLGIAASVGLGLYLLGRLLQKRWAERSSSRPARAAASLYSTPTSNAVRTLPRSR
jgi:membrane protein DedA with SNARE-associated domain